jgi:hypothetical protein
VDDGRRRLARPGVGADEPRPPGPPLSLADHDALKLIYDEVVRELDRQHERRRDDRARVTRIFAFLAAITAVAFGLRGAAAPELRWFLLGDVVAGGVALLLIGCASWRWKDRDIPERIAVGHMTATERTIRTLIIRDRLCAISAHRRGLDRARCLLTAAEVVVALITVALVIGLVLYGFGGGPTEVRLVP